MKHKMKNDALRPVGIRALRLQCRWAPLRPETWSWSMLVAVRGRALGVRVGPRAARTVDALPVVPFVRSVCSVPVVRP
jgi:hypothetical protein